MLGKKVKSPKKKQNGRVAGNKHTPALPHAPGKKKPKLHVCICGTQACKELTQLLSFKYLSHCRGGVTTLPIGNKDVDKFRRKRWLQYLNVEVLADDKRRLRVSRAHFRERDMEQSAGGGWGIKRFTTMESNPNEDDRYRYDDADNEKYKVITVPILGEEDMKKEYEDLISRQKLLLIPPREQAEKLSGVLEMTRTIIEDLAACRSSQMAAALQNKSQKGKKGKRGDEYASNASMEEDAKFAEFHLNQAQNYVTMLLRKVRTKQEQEEAKNGPPPV